MFFIALALAIFHIFYVSIPLLSENRGVNAYGVTTLLAVPMDQDLTDTVNAHVVMVEKLDLDKLKVGDKVLFGKWNGVEITFEGDELLMMKESDIFGIIS